MKKSKLLIGLTVVLACVTTIGAIQFAREAGVQNNSVAQVRLEAPTDRTPIADSYAVFKTNKGDFTVRLYGQKAPLAVKNFENLVKHGFYNRLTFHRVIDQFMIQGGDPLGNGTGGPGYTFADEINNDLHFDRAGILAMANSGPDTNGSQFFITVAPTPWLDGHYTIFGTVVKGYKVVEAISKVRTEKNDKPLEPVIIESISLKSLEGVTNNDK